jgi:ribonucleotide monophosphatase NagD (HAD superfamily)
VKNDKIYILGGNGVEEDIHNLHCLDLSRSSSIMVVVVVVVV